MSESKGDKPKLIVGLPKDKSVAAFKEFVTAMYKSITGEDTVTGMTEEEWKADCKAFWDSVNAD